MGNEKSVVGDGIVVVVSEMMRNVRLGASERCIFSPKAERNVQNRKPGSSQESLTYYVHIC